MKAFIGVKNYARQRRKVIKSKREATKGEVLLRQPLAWRLAGGSEGSSSGFRK